MRNFKLGLVGCGAMMGTHMKGVDMLEGIEIAAVCDIVRKRAEKVAEIFDNSPEIFTDYHDMVDAVDGVLVALPHDLHFQCGMYFALNKKHILMEKPLCNTEEECVKLIQTCDEMGVKLMCGYPVRFWPGVCKLKDMVDSGEYGKVIQMSVWTEQLTGAENTFTNKDEDPWGRTNRIGGGQLFSHGCHYIDILLWFLGKPIKGAHLGTNVGTPWMLREGTSSLIMKFENGAVAYHGATWGARGTRMGYDFQIMTENGLLEYDHTDGEVRVYNNADLHKPGHTEDNGHCKVIWKREGDSSKDTHYEIMHFLECIREDKEPVTSGKKALQSLRIIWELYNAEKNDFIADLKGMSLEDSMK